MLRVAGLGAFLLLFSSLGITAAGCQPPSETSEARGAAAQYAVFRAHAQEGGQHWNADVQLKDAASGSYALVFTANEPAHRGWFALPKDAVDCASAHHRGCTSEQGEVMSVTNVGPGGVGVLRASFEVGRGGYFTVVRLEEDVPEKKMIVEVRVVSEALARDERAQRFAIAQVR